MNKLEQRAALFAGVAHGRINQRRKYTNEPYINHPAAVVELVRSVPHTEEMLAAAWLHDVVGDCGVTLDEITDAFGTFVAGLVEQLTDVSKPSDGNRAVCKAIDRHHTAGADAQAKTIKLADLIDNTRSIAAHDPDFARIYLREKAALLEVLEDGDPMLWRMADELVKKHLKELAS